MCATPAPTRLRGQVPSVSMVRGTVAGRARQGTEATEGRAGSSELLLRGRRRSGSNGDGDAAEALLGSGLCCSCECLCAADPRALVHYRFLGVSPGGVVHVEDRLTVSVELTHFLYPSRRCWSASGLVHADMTGASGWPPRCCLAGHPVSSGSVLDEFRLLSVPGVDFGLMDLFADVAELLPQLRD